MSVRKTITIPNKISSERLNILNLSLRPDPLYVSGNIFPINSTPDKIKISNNIIIDDDAISLSAKNPPGYVVINIVITIKKIINATVPNLPKVDILFKNVSPVALSETVKSIIKYRNANTERIIVNKNDEPKYSFTYLPGSKL